MVGLYGGTDVLFFDEIHVGLPQRARKQPGRWKSNPRRNARNVVEWCAEWGQDPLLSPLVLSKTSVGQPKGARPGVEYTLNPLYWLICSVLVLVNIVDISV